MPGYPSAVRRKNRSSCASGSGNVPSYSIGFSVARRRNGYGTSRVTPSTVTCRSAIASSSADCVFGVARLISSTSTTLVKIGTGPELEVAAPLIEDRKARDVGRLEVGRALDARRRRALDAARDRAREHRLGGAGDVLEEHVPVADQRGQDELDLLALPVDDGLDVVEEPCRDLTGTLDARSLHLPVVVRERPLHRHDGIDGLPVWLEVRHFSLFYVSRTKVVSERCGRSREPRSRPPAKPAGRFRDVPLRPAQPDATELAAFVPLLRNGRSQAQESASAPATTSRISWVISAWRARFIWSVSVSISSPAFFDAFRIAVIWAPWNDAADSSSAR